MGGSRYVFYTFDIENEKIEIRKSKSVYFFFQNFRNPLRPVFNFFRWFLKSIAADFTLFFVFSEIHNMSFSFFLGLRPTNGRKDYHTCTNFVDFGWVLGGNNIC